MNKLNINLPVSRGGPLKDLERLDATLWIHPLQTFGLPPPWDLVQNDKFTYNSLRTHRV